MDGFRAKVMDDNGPVLVFGNTQDDDERIYCMSFIGSFEATNYNINTGQFTKVDSSDISFNDDVSMWSYIPINDTVFDILTQTIPVKSAYFIIYIINIQY